MMSFFKKKESQSEIILRPIAKGRVIALEKIPDKVFASGVLGEGVGFVFEGEEVYAPCNGEIVLIAETKHAIGMRTTNGAELLIHVGLDTVNLNGEGLDVHVSVHQKVKAGDKLITVDRKLIEGKGISLTTPVVVSNACEYNIDLLKVDAAVKLEDEIIRLSKK